jgi:hypothetical protein
MKNLLEYSIFLNFLFKMELSKINYLFDRHLLKAAPPCTRVSGTAALSKKLITGQITFLGN